jgi:hypothetical protein
MAEIRLEQALYGSQSAGGYQFLGRSPGFMDAWLPEAQRICTGFGERPAGVACPECLFVQPFGRRHVAVVQVADQGVDDLGRPGALAFRLLLLASQDYQALGGDPFQIADRFPPSWQSRGELPVLCWPAEPLPRRTVLEIQTILRPVAEGPILLAGAQALVDGGQVVFARPGPDREVLRKLWALLPTRSRCQLWPATFVFGNDLLLNAVVAPPALEEKFSGYLNEEQLRDYPKGRYEFHVQIAAEAGDQGDLDALFARRSRKDMWRLGIFLLVFISLLLFASNLLMPKRAPTSRKNPGSIPKKLDLPPADTPQTSKKD